ncbi:unnamed protein product [Didymodactylos carnosus]|uniref:Uncharacterized protein n=1 Tax=Didymodactylos carnosus TaxID=1234261 RepID=A0A816ANA2_9BILA|nr:unnamed protein product [Didymodactylos carnosus]CAF4473692.1 unnamed protein product [Didymodactylos carnosus]
MFPWKLHVSLIESGYMKTPLIKPPYKSFEDYWSRFSQDAQERWGRDYLQEKFNQANDNILFKHAEDPMKVVRALEHAVINTKPQIRYNPGWQATFIFYPLSLLPAWLLNLIVMKLDPTTTLPSSVHKQPKPKPFIILLKRKRHLTIL